MRIGVLVKWADRTSVDAAVLLARAEFTKADHCRGHVAEQVHFNPADCPEAAQVGGLEVFVDERIKPGHIRVTTVDLDPARELAGDMGGFESVVAQVATI